MLHISLFEVIGTVAVYLFRPVMRVNCALCCFTLHRLNKYAATVPITSNNDICNRYQYCNFGEARAESSMMMVYVNRNMLLTYCMVQSPS